MSVSSYKALEPVGTRLRANKNEKAVGSHLLDSPGAATGNRDCLQFVLSMYRDKLRPIFDPDIRCLGDIVDQILRHRRRQALAADQHNDVPGVTSEVHSGLPRGISAAYN